MKMIEQVISETEARLKAVIAEQEIIIAECLKPFPVRENYSSGLEYGNAYGKYLEDHHKGKYSSKAMGEAMQRKFDAESQLRDIANMRFEFKRYLRD